MTWKHRDYLTKAKFYFEKSGEADRDSADFLLFLSFASEHLVRASLCARSPILNASLDEDSVMFAGGIDLTTSPRTVDFRTALVRLRRAYPTITDAQTTAVGALARVRNSELHSDEAALASSDPNAVVPQIYSFCVRISEALNEPLDELLGPDEAKAARELGAALEKNRQDAIKGLIKTQKDRFYRQDEDVRAKLIQDGKPDFTMARLTTGTYLITEKCPACAQSGTISGTAIGISSPRLKDKEIIREVRILTSQFSCKVCEFKVAGLDELMAAGFKHEYVTTEDLDPIDHLGIDPEEYVDVARLVEEASYEPDVYMDE